jgi:hypothetical protein
MKRKRDSSERDVRGEVAVDVVMCESAVLEALQMGRDEGMAVEFVFVEEVVV